jgi:hypothetical protein
VPGREAPSRQGHRVTVDDDCLSQVVLLDPDDATVVRVEGREFGDGNDRILVTWEGRGEGPPWLLRLAIRPDAFMTFVVAVLNALGFPEGDLEYLADRYTKEFS